MDNEKDFIKGFNQGYTINKYDKKNFELLSKGFVEPNEYTDGFSEGGKEASTEKEQSRLNELGDLRKDLDRDLNMDRDL
ncbi:MAG: hypothetical protein ACI9O4_001235 [Chitinophagales bacterium]|jgi:hypothetical protein